MVATEKKCIWGLRLVTGVMYGVYGLLPEKTGPSMKEGQGIRLKKENIMGGEHRESCAIEKIK